jgi:hypothetical protein
MNFVTARLAANGPELPELMSEPSKRARAKAPGISLPGLSKLHNLLGNNGCTFVGAVFQLRRVACHSKGDAHRLDHLGAKAQIREVSFARHHASPAAASPQACVRRGGSSRIQLVFLLGRVSWVTTSEKRPSACGEPNGCGLLPSRGTTRRPHLCPDVAGRPRIALSRSSALGAPTMIPVGAFPQPCAAKGARYG